LWFGRQVTAGIGFLPVGSDLDSLGSGLGLHEKFDSCGLSLGVRVQRVAACLQVVCLHACLAAVCICTVPVSLGSMQFYMCRPWGQYLCIFICAGALGQHNLCIVVCAGASVYQITS